VSTIKFAAVAASGAVVTVLAVVQFGNFETRRLRTQVEELEKERSRLTDYAERLSASRRVAQVRVGKPVADETGRPVTTLVWQEFGESGIVTEPRSLEVIGRVAYFEALVIKFMHRHVGSGDPQRAASLVLFRRIFGDGQPADTAPLFDRSPPERIGESPQVRAAHAELWKRFWDLVDDPREAIRYGVRIAQIEAPGIPLRAGQVWEVAVDAAGGLNVARVHEGATNSPQTEAGRSRWGS
jgi:hypothetical protein